jgi:hypothetical protein
VWSVLAIAALALQLSPPGWVKAGLLMTAAYFFAAGFLDRRNAKGAALIQRPK